MFEFDTDVDKKLNAPSKRKIYDILVGRARECLKTAKSACLLGLSNWRYGEWILAENKNVERVTIVESSQLKFMYKDLEKLNKYNIIYVNDDKYVEALEGLSMKFDCIIMNPPYSRNLHLKILAEAIKHLKDENSVCVNLSPAQYLQDPLAKIKKTSDYNRFKELVSEHIAAFDLYKKHAMSQAFNIAVNTDLAVYVCNKDGGFDYSNVRKYRGFDPICIYDKCKAKVGNSNLSEHIVNYANRTSENFVSATMIGGINYRDIPSYDCLRRGNYGPFCNGKYNGKTIKEIKESCKLSVWGNVDNWPVICFDTSDECVNFFNCTDTICYHFLSYAFTNDQNVPLRFLPWLGDAINPRTGLKGYKGEWTDADLYQFFNITSEEQKVIEKTMAKYAAK